MAVECEVKPKNLDIDPAVGRCWAMVCDRVVISNGAGIENLNLLSFAPFYPSWWN